MDGIYYEVKNNVRLGDYSYLFLKEELYCSSYEYSYFRKIYRERKDDVVSFVVGMDGESLISILLLHKYSINDKNFNSRTKNSFYLNRKRVVFLCLGVLGTYVKPSYRNNGIAHQMLSLFQEEIFPITLSEYSNSDQQVIVATGYTYKMLKKINFPICISEAIHYPGIWKECIKNRLKYGIGTHLPYFD